MSSIRLPRFLCMYKHMHEPRRRPFFLIPKNEEHDFEEKEEDVVCEKEMIMRVQCLLR